MPDIPDEAVEAACEAYENDDRDYVAWSMYDETTKQECRVDMERALAAAYPLLDEELERRQEDVSELSAICERYYAENARLRAQVEAVRAIHQPRDEPNSITGDLGCRMCWVRYPCPTIAALSDEGKP